MTGNYYLRITVGNSPEPKRYLELTEENLNNLRRNFKCRLKQFHLLGIYEPDEVLNEAVLRLIKALHKGNTIPIPEAWIKRTGFNIMREMSRKQKCENLDESVVASGEDISLNLIKQEESERVHDAVQKLSPENQQLINLRFFLGLSWSQIAQHLNQNGNKVAVDTLRKRGERAIKELKAINELREVYFENLP